MSIGVYKNRSMNDKILLIKCNVFFDIISDELGISEDYVTIDSIESIMETYDNGLYEITIKKVTYDAGQEGEYGRYEISPYYYVEDCTVKKLLDVTNHKTKSEKLYIQREKNLKNMSKLQEYVASFSTDEIKYSLCKIWGGLSKLSFNEVSGGTFTMYKTIHEFENDAITSVNIRAIKAWITNYFNELTNKN